MQSFAQHVFKKKHKQLLEAFALEAYASKTTHLYGGIQSYDYVHVVSARMATRSSGWAATSGSM